MRITTAKPPEALRDLPINTRWRMCRRGKETLCPSPTGNFHFLFGTLKSAFLTHCSDKTNRLSGRCGKKRFQIIWCQIFLLGILFVWQAESLNTVWSSFTTLSAVPLFCLFLSVHVASEFHNHFITLSIRKKKNKRPKSRKAKQNSFFSSRKNRNCK